MTVLLVVGILVFLIVIHELGHFIAAKLFRVRVEEFGVGYPPRAFTFGKIGHTEYTLNWIPFGGFVRLFGDIGEEKHGRGSFVDAHRGVQALILIAGVAANTIIAWTLFAAALHVGVLRPVETPMPNEPVRLIVAHVVPGSPADAAGVKAGDQITSINAQNGEEQIVGLLTPDLVSDFVRSRGGKTMSVSYLRGGEESEVVIRPAHGVIPDEAGRPAAGFALYLVSERSLPWADAAKEAFSATFGAFRTVVHGLWSIVDRILAGQPNLSDVVGPLGLMGVVGDAAQSGAGEVLTLMAFISVNLAIINLIPIPALDGGRLALLGIETLVRRSAPRLALQILNAFGVALIMMLMIAVTYNDIARLLA